MVQHKRKDWMSQSMDLSLQTAGDIEKRRKVNHIYALLSNEKVGP